MPTRPRRIERKSGPPTPGNLDATFEVKAVDFEQRTIEGYANAFGNLDHNGDVVDPGAFARTLSSKTLAQIAPIVGHDSSRIRVGIPVSIREDDLGLFTKTRIFKTTAGDDLLQTAREMQAAGVPLGMSIGFRTRESKRERREGKMVRVLTDLDLVEYSFADPAFIANSRALVTSVKERHNGAGDEGHGDPPPDADLPGTKASTAAIDLEGSYEDLREDLCNAARVKLAGGSPYGGPYVSVVATFPDHVLVAVPGQGESYDDMDYWDISYTLGDDNEPTLGEPRKVQPAFVPAAAKARVDKRDERKATPSSGYDVNDSGVGAKGKGDFAYVDSKGKGHLPVHDEAHVRAAISRFNQTDFESDDAKKAAARKIKAKAKSLGIDLSDDSAVAQAAGDSGKTAVGILIDVTDWLGGLVPDVQADTVAAERLGIDTKAGRRMSSKHLDTLHTAMNGIGDLHDENCDLGDRCPMLPQGEKIAAHYDAQWRLVDIDLALARTN